MFLFFAASRSTLLKPALLKSISLIPIFESLSIAIASILSFTNTQTASNPNAKLVVSLFKD